MDEAERTERVEAFLESVGEERLAKFGRLICVLVEADHPLADGGRGTEREQFDIAFPDYHQGPDDMRQGYDPYDSKSTFFVGIDLKERVISGVGRMMTKSESPKHSIKVIDDLKARKDNEVTEASVQEQFAVEDLNTVVEFGTIVVPKEYRGTAYNFQASTLLYRSMMHYCRCKKAEAVVTILDEHAAGILDFLGVPFDKLEGAPEVVNDYMGSKKSYAKGGLVKDMEPAVFKRAAKHLVEAFKPSNMQDRRKFKKLIGSAVIGFKMATGVGLDKNIFFASDLEDQQLAA